MRVSRALAATIFFVILTTWQSITHATIITLDIHLTQSDIVFLPHNDGTVEIDAFPTFPQVVVNVGDHLTVRYTFDEFRVLLGDTAPLNSGLEAITFTMLPFNSALSGDAFVTMNLLGVRGNFTKGNPIYLANVGFSGGFANQAAVDLTKSRLLFAGAVLDADFSMLSEPLVLDHALWGAYGGSIRLVKLVPEPSSLALLGLAMFALAFSRRRSLPL
jgi:hypothetical protein